MKKNGFITLVITLLVFHTSTAQIEKGGKFVGTSMSQYRKGFLTGN